jgi:hypothetical protein
MSLFMCQKCGCVENTATGDYWGSDVKQCSECATGKWHGRFGKKSADGWYTDGTMIFHSDEITREGPDFLWSYNKSFKMVGVIRNGKVEPLPN